MKRKAYALLSKIERTWWYRGRTAAVHAALSRVRLYRIGSILDFGAGYGGMREELAGERVFAFEPDSEARKGALARGYVEVFSEEEQALARQYDLIALFDVLEHIEHDREFLQRARSALCDGGHVVITAPAYQFLWSVHDVNQHHFRRYTRTSLTQLLVECGYTIEYASYWNLLLFLPAACVRLLGRSGESSLSLSPPLDRFCFALVRLESRLMHRMSLPFGTGLIVVARAP